MFEPAKLHFLKNARISGAFSGTFPLAFLGFLGVLIFFSAIWVIYNTHQSRQLFSQLQRLQAQTEGLQVEWSQLLLEQGMWASDARVEKAAHQKLKMVLPDPNEIGVIRPTK